jgi:predicted DNA-binding transcriptional regulator AlpA
MTRSPRIVVEASGKFTVTALPCGRVLIDLVDADIDNAELEDPVYDKRGVAKRLLTSVRNIDNYMRQADPIPHVRTGGRVIFREKDIQEWMNERRSVAARRARTRISF